MVLKKLSIQEKSLTSFDGTKIGYQTFGVGAKPVILCNGLGGNILAWRPLLEFFENRCRFITWDYRGLFSSEKPKDANLMQVEDHLKDLECVLKIEKIKKALFIGWSMGVQINLEFYNLHPELYAAMILINGTSGNPFHTALNNPLSKYVLPTLNDWAKKVAPKVESKIKPYAEKLFDKDEFLEVLINLGFIVHPSFNREIFKELSQTMMKTDLHFFHHVLEHIGEHDASSILEKIKVPTLVITGEKDKLTPMKTAEKMTRKIKNSQFFVVPQASHYALLEFPELVCSRIEQFLNENFKE